MDKLTMIETLRERADISYEEAREVLEQAGGDLLEAIVLLEKQGKIRQDAGAKKEDAADSEAAKAAFEAEENGQQEKKSDQAGSFRSAIRSAFRFVLHTTLHITRREREVFTMPTWVLAILLPTFWGFIIPALVIGLFFGFRYSFTGRGSVESVNEFCSKAGSFADGVESGLHGEA